MKLRAFFKKLFVGKESNTAYKSNSFYKKQKINLLSIWNNKTYNDFGIERLFRIFLQLTAFIVPSGIIRQASGGTNLLFRKISIEAWGISKVVFLWIILRYDITTNKTIVITAIILSLDTLHFLICRIFLTDVFREAISYKRSLMMTFLNYIEICLCFALIYAYLDHSTIDSSIKVFNKHINTLQAIYFSFITSATIGYGDITPVSPLAIKIVVVQIMTSLFLVVVIISNVTNKIENDTFYNKKQKKWK